MKVAMESVLDVLEGFLILCLFCHDAMVLIGSIGVGSGIEGGVGNDTLVVVKDVGDLGGVPLIVGEVVKEVGCCCYEATHYISVLQFRQLTHSLLQLG